MMMHRILLYTAITHPRQLAFLVGSGRALGAAVGAGRRHTTLPTAYRYGEHPRQHCLALGLRTSNTALPSVTGWRPTLGTFTATMGH
jgi:hypothetical protein